MASGMEICACIPSPSHVGLALSSEVFEKVAASCTRPRTKIAACAFAVGASYAASATVTDNLGPGYSLKQEAIGLAVMGEIPLVVVNVQRGGPAPASRQVRSKANLMTPFSAARRRAQGRHGARHHIGGLLLLHHHARARSQRPFNMVVVGSDGVRPGHVAATVPAAEVQRIIGSRNRSPESGSGRGKAYDWTRIPGSRAVSFRVSPAACTP